MNILSNFSEPDAIYIIISIQHQNTSVTKRKQLQDITNSFELSNKRCDVKLLFPNDSELNKKISADMNDEECSMN